MTVLLSINLIRIEKDTNLCFSVIISNNGLFCFDCEERSVRHNFIFPTKIALTTKCPDIVIWSIKAKKVFVIELTVPFEENFDWAQQCKLEKYEDL